MHRFVFVALIAVALAGCDRFPDNGLQIGGMLPWENDCSIDPATELRRSSGLWDVTDSDPAGVQRVQQYLVTPLLESYLVDLSTEIQAPQNNLEVTDLEITLQLPDGTTLDFGEFLPNPYTVTATAVLPANDQDSSSLGSTISTAIPSSYRQAVAAGVAAAGFDQVIIVMRAVGTTRGGFTQTSAPFFWPVALCDNGCLDACPTPAAGATLSDVGKEEVATACAKGQDIYPYCSFPLQASCTGGNCAEDVGRQISCSDGFYACLQGNSFDFCTNQAIAFCAQ